MNETGPWLVKKMWSSKNYLKFHNRQRTWYFFGTSKIWLVFLHLWSMQHRTTTRVYTMLSTNSTCMLSQSGWIYNLAFVIEFDLNINYDVHFLGRHIICNVKPSLGISLEWIVTFLATLIQWPWLSRSSSP